MPKHCAAACRQHVLIPIDLWSIGKLDHKAIIEELSDLPASQGLLLFTQRLAQLLPEKRLVLRLLLRELLSPRSNMLTEVISRRQHALALFSDYLQRHISAGELRPHQPLIPLHMLISSMLILLLLDQPLEPYVTQFVETILNGINLEEENKSGT